MKHGGEVRETVPLAFAGPSTFKAAVNVADRGDYEIIVYAFDPLTGNSGVDTVRVKVN